MSNKIFVFGIGGHSRGVISVIEAEGKWDIAALVVDEGFQENIKSAYPILKGRNEIVGLIKRGINKAIVAIGDNAARCKIAEELEKMGVSLITTIHPSAYLMSDDIKIGKGCFIHAFSIIGVDSTIKDNVIVGIHSSIGHDCVIDEGVHIGGGSTIGNQAKVEKYSFIGINSVILPSITIGSNVFVGACSAVNKDVENSSIAVGVPARVRSVSKV